MTRFFLLTSMSTLLLYAYGCKIDTDNTAGPIVDSTSPATIKGLAFLDKCIEAHGGLDAWNKFVGLSYQVKNGSKSLFQLTHLKDRRTYSKSDNFELGSDGHQVWVTPNADKVPGKSAAFYYNLDFYFVAIPFVLKDPKVNSAKRYLDYQNIQGIMMPTKMENFRWIDGKIGKSSNRGRVISDYKFYDKIPDEKVFNVPEGAMTEPL